MFCRECERKAIELGGEHVVSARRRAVRISQKPNVFKFYVETVGSVKPDDCVLTALGVMTVRRRARASACPCVNSLSLSLRTNCDVVWPTCNACNRNDDGRARRATPKMKREPRNEAQNKQLGVWCGVERCKNRVVLCSSDSPRLALLLHQDQNVALANRALDVANNGATAFQQLGAARTHNEINQRSSARCRRRRRAAPFRTELASRRPAIRSCPKCASRAPSSVLAPARARRRRRRKKKSTRHV